MIAVQIALKDFEYANSLKEALLRDNRYRVLMTHKPEPVQESVVVTDAQLLLHARLNLIDPERVVVIADTSASGLYGLWQAGIRRVISKRDPISKALLAISAAALGFDGHESEVRF